jgi:hypothetical protein
MEYEAPYGVTDPNASYINGDPSIGRQGSIPPAAAFENPQREIVNTINNAQLVPTDQDLQQLTRAIREGKLNFCVDTGLVNQVQVTLPGPVLTSYTSGLTLRVLVAHTNTGPTVIAVGSVNPTNIKRRDGSELQANDLLAGQIATVVSDGTFFQLQNLGQSMGGGTASTYLVDIPYVRDTGTPNHLVGLYSPVLPNINEGTTVEINLKNNVTGITDFQPNNFPIHPVQHPDGSPIVSGDGVAGEIWMLCFDGTVWQLISATCCGSGPGAGPVTPPPGSGKSLQFHDSGNWNMVNQKAWLYRYVPINTNRQVWTYSMFFRRPVDNVIPIGQTPYATGEDIEVWFSSATAVTVGGGIQLLGTSQGNSFTCYWNDWHWQVIGNGVGTIGVLPPQGYWTAGNINDTKWHNLVFNADGAFLYIYVDGILFGKGAVSGNSVINAVGMMCIGRESENDTYWMFQAGSYGCSIRMAECIFVDGQCLDYTHFTQNIGGIVVPKAYTGTFGPNGFYLNWSDSSAVTSTTLGKDYSGNSNNFTPVNFQVTDVLADYPTLPAQL